MQITPTAVGGCLGVVTTVEGASMALNCIGPTLGSCQARDIVSWLHAASTTAFATIRTHIYIFLSVLFYAPVLEHAGWHSLNVVLHLQSLHD